MRGERLDLLAAAAEDERIAALQAHDAPALARQAHHQRVDLVLAEGVVVLFLADVDALGPGPGEFDERRRDQVVVQDSVRLAQ